MPAKAKKAKPAKKTVASRKVARRPMAKSVTAPSRTKKHNFWTKPYLLEPQEQFFNAHPNSRVLIALLTGALAFYIFIVWSNRVEIFPQAFTL